MFLVAVHSPAAGQEIPDTLSGLVFDEVTGNPVAGAAVDLVDYDDGQYSNYNFENWLEVSDFKLPWRIFHRA